MRSSIFRVEAVEISKIVELSPGSYTCELQVRDDKGVVINITLYSKDPRKFVVHHSKREYFS